MADVVGTKRAHAAVDDFAGRHKISQILLNLVKFAVGSAIDGSRKIIPGRKQGDKMVQEGLINIPLPTTPLKTKKKPDLKVAVGNDIHFQAKMEQDVNNNIKQQYNTSTKRVEGSQSPNKSDGDNDGFKGVDLLKKNARRVFIRSRL